MQLCVGMRHWHLREFVLYKGDTAHVPIDGIENVTQLRAFEYMLNQHGLFFRAERCAHASVQRFTLFGRLVYTWSAKSGGRLEWVNVCEPYIQEIGQYTFVLTWPPVTASEAYGNPEAVVLDEYRAMTWRVRIQPLSQTHSAWWVCNSGADEMHICRNAFPTPWNSVAQLACDEVRAYVIDTLDRNWPFA